MKKTTNFNFEAVKIGFKIKKYTNLTIFLIKTINYPLKNMRDRLPEHRLIIFFQNSLEFKVSESPKIFFLYIYI